MKRTATDAGLGSSGEIEDDDGEGVPSVPLRSLVVKGRPAGPGQFPYQAGIRVMVNTTGRNLLCGAVLISDRWLISAAHCCLNGEGVDIFLGSHKTMKDAPVHMRSNLVLVHPQNRHVLNDLALIRLEKPVALSDRVRPVQLPWKYRSSDFAGKMATVSGFGRTSSSDDRPSLGTAVLRYAHERILSHAQAEKILERGLPSTLICAVGSQGEVTCHGDSGGPLTVQGSDRKPILVGIVSHRYSLRCEDSRAHACTRITSYLPWIASVTKIKPT